MQRFQKSRRPNSNKQRSQPCLLRSRLVGQLMRPTVPKGRKSNGNRLKNLHLLTSFRQKIQNLLNKQIIYCSLELKRLQVKQAAAEATSRQESMLRPSEPQHLHNPPRNQEVRDHELQHEQMKMILTTFQLTASTGAQTRTRLVTLITMQLITEDREKQKHKLIDKPTRIEVQVLRLFQPMLQNRKRSPPALSLARPIPAMKQIKCARVKVVPNEEARTL